MKRLFSIGILSVLLLGLLVSCSSTDQKDDQKDIEPAMGTVSGEVTYIYNNFVGSKPDTDSNVILIPKNVDVSSLSLWIFLVGLADKDDPVYETTVSGLGNYSINVPVGDYWCIIISKNTNEKSLGSYDSQAQKSFGTLYDQLTEDQRDAGGNMASLRKTRTFDVTVLKDKTTTCSYDFGITYRDTIKIQ